MMRRGITLMTIFAIAIFSACDELTGIEKKHSVPSNAIFLLNEGDTLVYESGSRIEKYHITVLVNGNYSEYRTGTCGKGARDIIDFQAIYIKSIDSLKVPSRPGTELDDCNGPPGTNSKFISIIKNLVNTFQSQGIYYDARLNWYNDLSQLESVYTTHHPTIVLNNQQYKDVYQFDVPQNSSSNYEEWFYNKHYGFVGYKRKNGDVYNLIEPVVP